VPTGESQRSQHAGFDLEWIGVGFPFAERGERGAPRGAVNRSIVPEKGFVEVEVWIDKAGHQDAAVGVHNTLVAANPATNRYDSAAGEQDIGWRSARNKAGAPNQIRHATMLCV
jgi:hypothetical protein